MRAVPRRAPAAISGALASAWALFLLPAQLMAWYEPPRWAQWADRLPWYDGMRGAADAVGWTDHYALFGAAIAPSFLLLAVGMRPVASRLGVAGALLYWVTLAGVPVTLISYIGHAWPRPWNALWGAEALVLVIMGVLALGCGVVAGVRRERPWWAVLMLGLLLVVEVGSTLLFGYWPHGTMVLTGLWIAILALGWRRGDTADRAGRLPDASGARAAT